MTTRDRSARMKVGARSVSAAGALLAILVIAACVWGEQPRPAPTLDRTAPAAASQEPALIAGAAGIPAAQIASAAVVPVEIKDYEFLPATLTVPAGTTVTWTNHGASTHTVTSSANVFDSPRLDAGKTFSQTFSTPGTYAYYCKIHRRMTATIEVK